MSSQSTLSRRRLGGGYSSVCNRNSYINELFLSELLCRLPIKAVFRFCCVSRQCRSIISDPSFGRFYLSRQQGSPSATCKLVCFSPIVRLIDDHPKTNAVLTGEIQTESHLGSPELLRFTLPKALRGRSSNGKEGFFIKAADDNGFLLIARQGPSIDSTIVEFYICNAITKQSIIVPAHKFFERSTSVGFVTQAKGGILTSYRVVLINWPLSGSAQNFLDIQLFSSERGKWVDLRIGGDRPVRVFHLRGPVLLNSTLHWMDEYGRIIAYDPYADFRSFRYIDLPERLRFKPWTDGCFVYRGRSLRYFENAGMRIGGSVKKSLNIWELRDDHQWRLAHVIRLEDIQFPSPPTYDNGLQIFGLASFHPLDPNILYLYVGVSQGVMSYDLTTRKLEALNWHSGNEGHSWMRLFFRALPLWPVSISPSLVRS